MSLKLSNLRVNYERGQLRRANAPANPIELFNQWLSAAFEAQVPEAHAMTLATASPDGRPSARTVLLKGCDESGFSFYTNYTSRKAVELVANPRAALVLWWSPLERQVRVEGSVEKLSAQESDAYFNSRPRGSQLSAIVSNQSSIIGGRHVLEEKLAALERQFADELPQRPDYWGGYRVVPEVIEFWQGGADRLHDRLCYTRQSPNGWTIVRLAP